MTPTTEELKALLKAATPAPWTGHNMTHAEGRAMTPEEIGEYVCNSVKMGEEGRFLFVSGKHADGGDCDVCHTGNGPRGAANTLLIALAPTLAARVVALEEALTPSGSTKAAYSGEFHVPICKGTDLEGEEYTEYAPIPWTVIKDIMKAFAARAKLEERG